MSGAFRLGVVAATRTAGGGDPGPGPGAPGWDPSVHNRPMLFTDSDQTVQKGSSPGPGGLHITRSKTSRKSGKWYVEFSHVGGSPTAIVWSIGIASTGYDFWTLVAYAGRMGYDAKLSMGMSSQGAFSFNSSNKFVFPAGDKPGTVGAITQFAIDFDAQRIWVGLNGTWKTGDPGNGTSPTWNEIPDDEWWCAVAITGDNNSLITLRDTASLLAYLPPSGFRVWAD